MSRISELIAEHCPAGVEHTPLGDLGMFVRGNGLQKSDLSEQGFPAIHYGQIHTFYGLWTKTTKSYTDSSRALKLRKAAPGDLIIATTSEDDEAVAKATAWIGEGEVAVSGDAYIFRHKLDPQYMSYLFQSDQFQEQKKRFITGAKVRRIAGDSLAKITIPVPPLAVQREIVITLNQFLALETQLGAELEGRRRQYEHYAHVLLVNDDDIPRAPLGDIATIVRGASPRPIQSFITTAEDGVPWIKIGDVPLGGKYITSTGQRIRPAGAAKSRRVRPGDFVLSNSMSFGRPYISKIDGYIHDGWLAISGFEESFVPDFLYHLLRSAPVQAEFERRAGAGTVKNLNADIVKSVSVPLPPRERQERIVGLLDRFDALVNDPSSGLPAEIRLRRKQYEYYRDKLLSFDGVPV